MHVSLPLPEEETEAQRGYSPYQGITDEGFKPGVSDPRALSFPSYMLPLFSLVGMEKGNKAAQCWIKESGTYPI